MCFTKSNLQIECSQCQNSNILHKNNKNPKIHMEAQKTLNSQIKTEQKEQYWWYLISRYTTGHDKTSMVPAQKQTRTSVEWAEDTE